MGKRTPQDRIKESFFKLNKKRESTGTLKIFADELNPSSSYKNFLLSPNDTSQWMIKETLEKYGLKHEDPSNYCLVQIVIPSSDQFETTPMKRIVLRDQDCPLQICWNHHEQGYSSVVFKMIRCPSEYVHVREQESINDRTFYETNPILIETDSDGRDLSTPSLLKIPLNLVWIGRAYKSRQTTLSNYLTIEGAGIERDHCQIQNQHGVVTVFPKGETRCEEKKMTTPFVLEHGNRIRFGRSLTFRFYDPLFVSQTKSINFTKNTILNQAQSLNNNETIDPRARVNVLPGLLEVPEENETIFLDVLFDRYPLTKVPFRLSAVYMLYMALRYRLSSWVKPLLTIEQKQENLVSFLSTIEQTIEKKFQDCHDNLDYLVYWIANISELIFFLKYDRHLTSISQEIRVRLNRSLENAFYRLINLIQTRLERFYSSLIDLRDDLQESMFDEIDQFVPETFWTQIDSRPIVTLKEMLNTLASLMTLLRKSRINPTITIEIFSQIFRSMNSWLFNRFVCQNELKLCSYTGAERIFGRLRFIRRWAQSQGLELIVDQHLSKVHQLCSLLMSPKREVVDAEKFIFDPNWSINSIQIRHIFNNYFLTRNEISPSTIFVKALLSNCSQRAEDELLEDEYIRLPFALPDDGYSCENLRGIPEHLLDFLETINHLNCCRLFLNPYSLGYWTEFLYMTHTSRRNQETHRLETIVLKKHENSLGLSIVSAKSDWQHSQGIYVQEIIHGSAAQINGRLEPGDQILAVEQTSLIDRTQEQAAEILRQCGPTVTLQVLKNAAQHQGLGSLFVRSNSSPKRSPKFAYLSRISQASREMARYSEPNRSPSTTQFSWKNNKNENLSKSRENLFVERPKLDELKLYRSNPTLNSTNRLSFVSREDIPPVSASIRLARATSQMTISPRKDKLEVKFSWKHENETDETDRSKFDQRISSPRVQSENGKKLSNSRNFSLSENEEFEERLQRRLEQFERQREIERAKMNEILNKRREETEKRSREERERATRADRELKQFQNRIFADQQENFEVEREQKRLSKHFSFPIVDN